MEQSTAREELAAIRSLMADSQSFLRGTWSHQLVWGLIGTVGVTATWGAISAEAFGTIAWIWAVMIGLGWTYSLLRMRAGAGAPVRNVASRAFGGVWLALGITLTLLGTVTIGGGGIDPRALPGLIAVVLGGGYFATGFLSGLRWLQVVAGLWWIGGVLLLLWSSTHALLVLAAMTLLLEVGPALVLRRTERARSAAR